MHRLLSLDIQMPAEEVFWVCFFGVPIPPKEAALDVWGIILDLFVGR